MERFNRLPPEINELIVASVPDPEIYGTCENPDFSPICDWNFWRRRAIDKWEIPAWYFDLGLARGITGAYRYLEVSTQFQPTMESIASISDGVVYGIYTVRHLSKLALKREDLDLIKQLRPVIPESLFDSGLAFGLFLESPFSSYISNILLGEDTYDISDVNLVFVSAYYGNWDSVINFLNINNDPVEVGRLLTYLIYTQKSTAFAIVQQFIGKTDNYQITRMLRATVQCGNKDQFYYMVGKITNPQQTILLYKDQISRFDLTNSIGNLHCFEYDMLSASNNINYSFLYDAYAGANQDIINYLKTIIDEEESVETYKLYESIRAGRNKGLSNPVSAYNLVNQSTHNNYLSYLNKIEIDITQLLVEKFPKFLDLAYLNSLGGNVDITNYLLEKLQNFKGFQRGLAGLDLKPSFRVDIQTILSYQK